MKRIEKIRRYGLVAIAGAVLGLATAPTDLYAGVWLALAALAWALDADPRWPAFASKARVALTGARRAWVFGFAANLVMMRFIPAVITRFTPLPWAAGAVALILLAAFEGLRWLAAGVACETLARARVPRPVAFAAGVYAGTFLPTMLPWTVADAVSPWPSMVQLADVVGGRGVAALLALEAGLLAACVKALAQRRVRAAWPGGAAVVLLAAHSAFGAWRMDAVERSRETAPREPIALVQPGIGATTRWEEDRAPEILEQLTTLTRGAEAQGAELVVWPEAAYPYRLPRGSRRVSDGPQALLQPGVHGPVLTGLVMPEADGASSYNSALVATAGGALSESYDKRHLLWFGESVPLADRLPWMRRTFFRGLGLTPGDRSVALVAGRARVGVLICYEDTLPEAGREASESGPTLLVDVTNDAWFAGSAESENHLRMAAMRSVELRRDLVRAVNMGVSSWVDAAGRVRSRGSPRWAGVLATTPALLDAPPTLYARLGDAPWALLALVAANVAVWRAARRRR